jgi:hypothetical protein
VKCSNVHLPYSVFQLLIWKSPKPHVWLIILVIVVILYYISIVQALRYGVHKMARIWSLTFTWAMETVFHTEIILIFWTGWKQYEITTVPVKYFDSFSQSNIFFCLDFKEYGRGQHPALNYLLTLKNFWRNHRFSLIWCAWMVLCCHAVIPVLKYICKPSDVL